MNQNSGNFDPDKITYGNIWNLSWPVMVSSLAFTLLDVIDMFWIGKLGHISVAAVSMVGSYLFILISSMTLVSSGTIAFVSRASGSNDRELLKKSISISLFFAIMIALVLIFPSILFAGQILQFFGAEGSVLSSAITYMRIMLFGFTFLFILDTMYNVFFGTGDSKTPMKLTITTLLINILLDPFLIFGWFFFPRLGISGAAIASSFSILIGFSLFTVFFLKKFGLIIPSFQKDLSISFLKTGIPAFFYGITRPVTGMLIYKIVSLFGDVSIAAFGIGSRVIGITFIYMDGLMVAVQTFVGQLLGKKDIKKAKESVMRSLKMGYMVQIITCSLIFVLSDELTRIFSDNPYVVKSGSSYLKIIGISLLFYPLSATFNAVHRGSGYNVPPLITSIIANWLIKLPLSYFLARYLFLDIIGAWSGIGFSLLIESVFLFVFYKKGGWIKYKIPSYV